MRGTLGFAMGGEAAAETGAVGCGLGAGAGWVGGEDGECPFWPFVWDIESPFTSAMVKTGEFLFALICVWCRLNSS